MSDDQQAAREAAWKAYRARILEERGYSPNVGDQRRAFDAAWDARGVWERGRGVPEECVGEFDENNVRGECPVCGGETEHSATCEIGVLTRERDKLRATNENLVEDVRDLMVELELAGAEPDNRRWEREHVESWTAAIQTLADTASEAIANNSLDNVQAFLDAATHAGTRMDDASRTRPTDGPPRAAVERVQGGFRVAGALPPPTEPPVMPSDAASSAKPIETREHFNPKTGRMERWKR